MATKKVYIFTYKNLCAEYFSISVDADQYALFLSYSIIHFINISYCIYINNLINIIKKLKQYQSSTLLILKILYI